MFQCSVRSVTEEVADSIGGSEERKVGLCRKEGRQPEDSGEDDEAHGAVGFARAEDALHAEVVWPPLRPQMTERSMVKK